MINLPAVCRNCGLTFNSGIVIDKALSSSFVGNKSQCPQCGNMAEILDATTDDQGNLHFSKTAYDVLSSPAVDPATLEKLKKIIFQQQNKGKPSKEEFIKAIQVEVPELSGLADILVPTNPSELYGLLTFILTLVMFLQAIPESEKAVDPIVINNFYGTENPEASAYNAAYQSGALRRKDPCPCGSGKKFKNCHGN